MTTDLLGRLAAIALVAALSLPAHAQDKERGKELFLVGLEAAAKQDYRLAIGRFLASYEAYPHPTTARNVAKAYEDFGDLQRARLWYRRFQEIAPHRAAEVAEDLLRVEERLDPLPAAAPAPAAVPAAAPDEKPDMAEVLKRLGARTH